MMSLEGSKAPFTESAQLYIYAFLLSHERQHYKIFLKGMSFTLFYIQQSLLAGSGLNFLYHGWDKIVNLILYNFSWAYSQ